MIEQAPITFTPVAMPFSYTTFNSFPVPFEPEPGYVVFSSYPIREGVFEHVYVLKSKIQGQQE
jgi:hypothetical protein